jgi:hypothetical protein
LYKEWLLPATAKTVNVVVIVINCDNVITVISFLKKYITNINILLALNLSKNPSKCRSAAIFVRVE